MIKTSAAEFIRKHLKSYEIIESVSMTADYKTHNREMKKLNKLMDILKNDLKLATEVYEALLKSENAIVRSDAAAACLKIGILEVKAESILDELAKREDIGITSLNCKMMLKVWRGEI